MLPQGSWGGSTPQAQPKPRPRSAAPCGPAGGPARGDEPRCPDKGGGGPSHSPLRPAGDVQSGPRGSDTQPVGLPAAGAGMFNFVPLYSAMRRDAPVGAGQPPMGTLAEQGWGVDAQGHGPPRGMGAPPLAAGGPPQGTPPGAAGRGCLALLVAPATAPALVLAGDGGAPPCLAPHLADNGWLPALDAAARDAPLHGLVAAVPAAAAPPGAPALDHGNQPEESGGARAVRFGEHATNEDDDDDEWGDWGGDDSSGPILHGTRPIGVEDDFGFGGGGSTGWGWRPGGNGLWPPRRVGPLPLWRTRWLGCLGGFPPACCYRPSGDEDAAADCGDAEAFD